MTVRQLRLSDIPILQEMAERSGFPYPDLNTEPLELVHVVVDDEDRPLMACAAKRILELYLWSGEFERPLAKVHALRLLHDTMSQMFRAKGYREANVFLPPVLASRFARRLEKTFGWVKNWPSWAKHF